MYGCGTLVARGGVLVLLTLRMASPLAFDGMMDGYCTGEDQSSSSTTAPSMKKRRVVHYKTRFNQDWMKKHPCISQDKSDSGKAHCKVCSKSFSICHQGYRDVERHLGSIIHTTKSRDVHQHPRITDSFLSQRDSMATKVISAEVKFTAFLLEHNLPLAVADRAGPLFRSMFPDSKIASYYGCARTKTTSIVNRALATEFSGQITEMVQTQPFTLSLDGSNDEEEKKLVRLTVRVFDQHKGRVVSRFLDMCLCSSGTAAAYFENLEQVFTDKSIPWQNCIAFSIDSASVNIGRHNSIKTRIEKKYPPLYTLGCPCHFIHNTAHYGAKRLEAACGFDVEGVVVDVFYYFDHSTKRKGELREFATFRSIESRKILKFVSTHSLSLQTSVERILQQYEALRSYFLSQDENESDQHHTHLQIYLSDPLTEVYLLFYQSIAPVFTTVNLLLQRDSPCIHFLHAMEGLLKKLLGRFITVSVMDAAPSVSQIDYTKLSNQLSDLDIMVGFSTKQALRRVVHEVEPRKIDKFYKGVRAFFTGATQYLLTKFSWDDEILTNACLVDFDKTKSCTFHSVKYFLSRFPQHLPTEQADSIYDEFRLYQGLVEVPSEIDLPTDFDMGNGQSRADILWHGLEKLKDVNGKLMFGLLSKVAKLVLVLPHSNADKERVFILVRKNKTPFRANLSLDMTFPSILHCKVNGFSNIKCFEYEPSQNVLRNAKSATWQYKKEHSSS